MRLLKIFFLCSLVCCSFAKHYFNICYFNWSNNEVKYNNDGLIKKWKEKDNLIGSGVIMPQANKCFTATDETIFFMHYITFYVNDQWFGLVNPAFSKPYTIAQKAIAAKGTKLMSKIDKTAHEQFYANVHIMSNDTIILSKSIDPKDANMYITPQIFK